MYVFLSVTALYGITCLFSFLGFTFFLVKGIVKMLYNNRRLDCRFYLFIVCMYACGHTWALCRPRTT